MISAKGGKAMGKLIPMVGGAIGGCVVLMLSPLWLGQRVAVAEEAQQPTASYVGAKECASCHFDQFLKWKATKHAKEAFTKLPAAYRADANCLKCHATGHGLPGGFTGVETPGVAGVSCEACHGPGSMHAKTATKYSTKKLLSDAEKKQITGAIARMPAGNVCAACHVDKGHKEHPKYEK
jgi:hypothetical protein